MAGFMSLLTVALVLLLGVDWVLYRRSSVWKDEQRLRIALVLAAPFLLWSLWYLRAYLHYDRFVLVNTFLHMEQRSPVSPVAVGSKLLSFLLHLGGTFVFPLAGWLAFTGRSSRRIYVAVFFLAFIPAYVWYPEWPWLQAFLFAGFLTTALLVIIKIGEGAVRLWRSFWACKDSAERVFWRGSGTALNNHSRALLGVLFLWFWGILAACCLVFYSGSVRYAVLALPAFLLLWQYALETAHSSRTAKSLLLLSLALTLPYSLAIASADYRFADVYREEPARILEDVGNQNKQIWYTGEWGFRYYMEKLGARPLTKTGVEPVAGDIIVKPYIALPGLRSTTVTSSSVFWSSATWIRILCSGFSTFIPRPASTAPPGEFYPSVSTKEGNGSGSTSIRSRNDTTAPCPRLKGPGEYTFQVPRTGNPTFHVPRFTFHVRASYICGQERNS